MQHFNRCVAEESSSYHIQDGHEKPENTRTSDWIFSALGAATAGQAVDLCSPFDSFDKNRPREILARATSFLVGDVVGQIIKTGMVHVIKSRIETVFPINTS